MDQNAEHLAYFNAAIHAQNTAEVLRRLNKSPESKFSPEDLEGIGADEFYDLDFDSRFEMARKMSRIWEWKEDPEDWDLEF